MDSEELVYMLDALKKDPNLAWIPIILFGAIAVVGIIAYGIDLVALIKRKWKQK